MGVFAILPLCTIIQDGSTRERSNDDHGACDSVAVGATTENLFLRLEFHTCYNSQILPVGIHHPSSQENGKRWYGLGVELGNGSVPSFL